jgi:6-pyruvoyltetrahydropterin/6-carboxytetrahydropterin synthase
MRGKTRLEKYLNQRIPRGIELAGSLTERIASRLGGLEKGAYSREYRTARGKFRTNSQMVVGEILNAVSPKTRLNVSIPGTKIVADFELRGRFFFVDREFTREDLAKLKHLSKRCILVQTSSLRSDREDTGIRAIELGTNSNDPESQTIFLDDPSFNFDYAHILPHTRKCSVMHGHTSAAMIEIIGRPIDGMVVDFGIAKKAIRTAIGSLDHKLFINERYVVRQDAKSVLLRFRTVHGGFTIRAPKETIVLLEGEATVENLAREILSRILPKMPGNVSAVGVYVYEGLNKGSHILAQLHQREAEKKRKKR